MPEQDLELENALEEVIDNDDSNDQNDDGGDSKDDQNDNDDNQDNQDQDDQNNDDQNDNDDNDDQEFEAEVTINLTEFGGGKFKSTDEIASVLTSHEEITSRLAVAETAKGEIEGELETLKVTLEETKNANLLAKYPLYYKLAKFSEENPESGKFYQQLALGNPDPIAVLKANFLIEHPEFKDREADVDKMVKARYKDYLGAEADPESEEYALAKLTMEADAGSAKSRILKDLDGIEVPKLPTEDDVKAKRSDYINSWKPSFKKIVSEIGDVKVTLPDPKDPSKNIEFTEIKLSGTEKDKYVKLAASIIGRGGLKNDEDTINSIKAEVKKQIIVDNIDDIVRNTYNNGHADGSKGHRAKVVNSKSLPSGRRKSKSKVDHQAEIGNQLIEDSESGKF